MRSWYCFADHQPVDQTGPGIDDSWLAPPGRKHDLAVVNSDEQCYTSARRLPPYTGTVAQAHGLVHECKATAGLRATHLLLGGQRLLLYFCVEAHFYRLFKQSDLYARGRRCAYTGDRTVTAATNTPNPRLVPLYQYTNSSRIRMYRHQDPELLCVESYANRV